MGKPHQTRFYAKPAVSNYAQRHPENARHAQPVEEERVISDKQKKRGPDVDLIKDFQKGFLAEAKSADVLDYPTSPRAAFQNVLTEAVMMKAARATLQDPHTTAADFARTICENLYRRTRDHYASTKDMNFGRMLQHSGSGAHMLEPEFKQALTQLTTAYFDAHIDALRAGLEAQRSAGR